jgi:flagellar protein FlaG
MNNLQSQPRIKVIQRADYREQYANSVQVRPSTWDFFLQFGTLEQKVPDEVEIHMFQGIYLSPQQAKAVQSLLQTHVANYEKAFGEIQLTPVAETGSVQ